MHPIPVLLYHSVSDSPAPAIADFCVSEAEFARQVDAIAGSGREAVGFAELVRRLSAGDAAALENCVCVTFEDGWSDNLAAAERLAARELPATVFVTTGYIGRDGFLDSTQLRELAAMAGVEIGAHSVGHPRLDQLDKGSIRNEITESRRELEAQIGSPVTTFAYPHGCHDARVIAAVREAGFSGAAAVKNALSHPDDDPYAVARWTVTSSSDVSEIEALLAGNGAPLAWRGERLRTRAFRYYRRLSASIR